jgi:hypothetical protein
MFGHLVNLRRVITARLRREDPSNGAETKESKCTTSFYTLRKWRGWEGMIFEYK